jgi:hypothetical protein
MNKDELEKNDEVLENLKYDLDALLVHSINELKTLAYDVRSTHVSEYLDIYLEQRESLIEMTEKYRKSLLSVYDSDSQ